MLSGRRWQRLGLALFSGGIPTSVQIIATEYALQVVRLDQLIAKVHRKKKIVSGLHFPSETHKQ
jgi:hypothetical protein